MDWGQIEDEAWRLLPRIRGGDDEALDALYRGSIEACRTLVSPEMWTRSLFSVEQILRDVDIAFFSALLLWQPEARPLVVEIGDRLRVILVNRQMQTGRLMQAVGMMVNRREGEND